MKKIYSKIKPHKLLHLVIELDEINDRVDFLETSLMLQISAIKKDKGDRPLPHIHKFKSILKRTQILESWYVHDGEIMVSHFDVDGSFISREILNRGSMNITIAGGHTFEVLSEKAIILEHKVGPYRGVKRDKIQFNWSHSTE